MQSPFSYMHSKELLGDIYAVNLMTSTYYMITHKDSFLSHGEYRTSVCSGKE